MQNWIDICTADRIIPDTGVCALVGGEQVAVFHLAATGEYFAVSNFDPFSQANVLSRGILGCRDGKPKIASPIYKQNFCLQSGQCLDDPAVKISTFAVRCENGLVQVGV